MIHHNLAQGSAQWLAYRAQHFNASDAPAMMGASPHKTRSALLRELHIGISKDVGSYVEERVYATGHKFEAAARAIAEELLGEELYPIVGSLDKLSASFDGLTMDERIVWEHKTVNDKLRQCFRQMNLISASSRESSTGRELPLHHRIQMEQQMHVSGAQKALFTASRWSDDGDLLEALHCWYIPDAELRAEILSSWEQFGHDLANYVVPIEAPPAPTGRVPEVLPALRIEVRGEVTASNLAEFKTTALRAIRGVRRELTTDQDFADAEAAVKWCGDVESRLDAAKQHALSQTSSIDILFRTIDEISAEARRVRLEVEKLVKSRKETIREEIIIAARRALQDHVAALARECAPAALNLSGVGDFAAAIKGKRTLQTLRESCDAELAKAKIAVDAQARGIRANLVTYAELGADKAYLFSDLSTLLQKAADDFGAALRQRLAEHEAKEAQRIAAERERIRAEEEAKAHRALTAAPAPAGTLDRGESAAGKAIVKAMAPPPAPRADEPATLKLGTICERLAPISITAAGLEELGIRHSATDKAAKLYRPSELPLIVAALVQHLGTVC